MYIYDKGEPPALNKWDFIDPVTQVCSNATLVSNAGGVAKYRCEGHPDGDKLQPSYHGDPEREHRFWVYSRE